MTRLLPFGALLAIIVIAAVVFANLSLGGPLTASDSSFSVKNPGGWSPNTWSLFEGYRVVLSVQANKYGGVGEFAVADYGRQVPLELIPAAWEQMQAQGQSSIGTLGGLRPITVGGAPAMEGDISGTSKSGELVIIDYNNTTYLLAMVSSYSAFSQMRGDFDAMLSSWTWLH